MSSRESELQRERASERESSRERALQRESSSTSKNVLKLEVVYMMTTDLTVLIKSSFSDKTTSAA